MGRPGGTLGGTARPFALVTVVGDAEQNLDLGVHSITCPGFTSTPALPYLAT